MPLDGRRFHRDGKRALVFGHAPVASLAPLGAGSRMSIANARADASHRSRAETRDEPPSTVPSSDVDPFSIEFFEDPHRIHEELREAGPVVWLSRYGIYAVARYAEVHAVLND